MVWKKKKKEKEVEEEEEIGEEEEEEEPEEKVIPKAPKQGELWEAKLIQSPIDPYTNVEAIINNETEETIYTEKQFWSWMMNKLEKISKAVV